MTLRLTDDPARLLQEWFDAAQSGRETDAAMALASVDGDGQPSVRVVLCRGIETDGSIIFYTNYRSRKARELDAHPRAAATFHWVATGRQIRLEGRTERVDEALSDSYFAGRSRESQLGAWASPQSEPISEHDLFERWREAGARFEGREVPRPPWWGGYRLRPHAIELWVHGAHRLHERIRFERRGEGWSGTRIGP